MPAMAKCDALAALGCHFHVAQQFIDEASAIKSSDELRSLMDAICNELGFRHFALIHHTDLRELRPGVININNYPPVWAEQFIAKRLYRFDPVIQACFRTGVGFRWSKVGELIDLNPRQERILEAASREGLADGLTMPSAVKGEYAGSCSFAAPRRSVYLDHCEILGQLVGAFGFEAARRLTKREDCDTKRKLSPRQRECVVLVAQGKSNWEIGQILGLSPVTIAHYVSDARARYDVSSRQQLVVRALLESEINFPEIMPAQYV